jgi:2-amino-4-hydroxy-6-hydroxymethyldihydropteridine diphosphokinase
LNAPKLERHHAWLSLGSNIDPEINLPAAVVLLCEAARVKAVSSTWETPPDGSEGPNFLNAVVEIETPLESVPLKHNVLRMIEARLGRMRSADKSAPRSIDLDILIFDGETVDPAIWNRGYLAAPLAELLPSFREPGAGETLAQASLRLLRTYPALRREDVVLGQIVPQSCDALVGDQK